MDGSGRCGCRKDSAPGRAKVVYAALEHTGRLDRNAQADYEQLAYLFWADVIVEGRTGYSALAHRATAR
jgi:hypothetical protein